MSEGEENPLLPKLEKRPAKNERLPIGVAEMFLAGTLGEGMHTIYEGEHDSGRNGTKESWKKAWRVAELEVNAPGIGPAILRVEYFKQYADELMSELTAETMQFDLMTAEINSRGLRDRISEMWWSRPAPGYEEKYPHDLRNGHRYTVPEFRGEGAAKYTYGLSEAWAQQLADLMGREMTLAFSTDQPLTMDWIEKRGYEPFNPEEGDIRTEVKDHPEYFVEVPGDPLIGQMRNVAVQRNGKPVRVWFKKVLQPTSKA